MAAPNKIRLEKRNPSTMRRLSISLPSNIYVELERLAARDSRSLAWIARKAVQDYVERQEPLFHQSAS